MGQDDFELTAVERQMTPPGYDSEERINLAIEAEHVYEELNGISEGPPTFADGTTALVIEIRESIGKRLYEQLDERFGDD